MTYIRSLLVAACLTAASAAHAETNSIYACGTSTPSLNFCRREVSRIRTELKRREANYRRTGQGYNAGNSLVGCAADCLELYPSLLSKFK